MISHHPPLDADRTEVDAPILAVTVLEDRALVRRQVTVSLSAGPNRLAVPGLSPLLQDVSLRASVSTGDVTDARARRTIRILRSDKPEAVAALDAKLESLRTTLQRHQDDQQRAAERSEVVNEMLQLGAQEIPEDAGWGTIDPSAWSKTFDDLFERSRELLLEGQNAWFAQEDLAREALAVEQQRRVADRLDQHLTARAVLDVMVPTAGEVLLTVEYVVPNALWRPMHRAELVGDELVFTSRAAIWQNTGEDWTNVDLSLSTAQGSLGNEPPKLTDDLLTAQRKADQVVLEAREVTVNTTGKGGGGGAPGGAVDLPGVDDGGEVQDLQPDGRATIPDGGRPVFLDLEVSRSAAKRANVCFPEIDPRVHVAVDAPHAGTRPLLAGPVELVRENGPVGNTSTLFVSPGALLELGFGPHEAVRVQRTSRVRSDKKDPVDKWQRRHTVVNLFLSNVGSEAVTVVLTERIPVSEVDHVVVSVDADRTTPGFTLDEANGFVVWSHTLAGHSTSTLTLDWQLAMAPEAVMKG